MKILMLLLLFGLFSKNIEEHHGESCKSLNINYSNELELVKALKDCDFEVRKLRIISSECDLAKVPCIYMKALPDCILKLDHLTTLYVHNSNNLTGLEKLNMLESMRYLDLTSCRDINIEEMGKLSHLDTLVLIDNNLKPTDLMMISKMDNLKYLAIGENPDISREHIQSLSRNLSSCQIDFN